MGNNLISWYKGDDGLTASTWADKIGNNTLTASGSPIVVNTLNFNTVGTLDGTTNSYGFANADGWLGSTNGTTYYYVARSTSAPLSSRVVYARGLVNGATTSMHGGMRVTGTAIFASGTLNTSPSVGDWVTAPTNLSRSGFNGGSPASYYVNANGGTESVGSSITPTIAGLAPFYIGRSIIGGNIWTGDIAEVMPSTANKPPRITTK